MKSSHRLFLVTVFLVLAFGQSDLAKDPTVYIGEYFISDIKGWAQIPIVLSLFEIFLICALIGWACRGHRFKKSWASYPGTLSVPMKVFGGFVLFALALGLLRGASSTIALWEVRGFLMMFFAYFLTGVFFRNEAHLNQFVWIVLSAASTLSIVNILRWLLYLRHTTPDDLVFDHVDSVVLVFALLLCFALLTFGGTRTQQRYALCIIPLIFFAMEVMKRRAAFAILFIGIIAFVLFALRLRPRVFWKSVLPLAVIGVIYLALFWHNQGVWGQPARAVSSIISPDARDAASNSYRTLEKLDIIINIKSSPILGLGFGTPFAMTVPLPDLSFWRFWHFTTHNSVLWVWMKGGFFTFVTFWWLLGRSLFDGGKAVESRREEWSFVAQLRKTLRRRNGVREDISTATRGAGGLTSRQKRELMRAAVRERAVNRTSGARQRLGFNVPTWERSDDKRSVTAKRTGALALLVTAICLIPMQVMYSYVDLGLTSERDMLLFGLALGIVARANYLLGIESVPVRERHRKHGKRSHQAVNTAPSEDETLTIVRELARQRRRPASVRIVEAPTPGTTHTRPLSTTDSHPHRTADSTGRRTYGPTTRAPSVTTRHTSAKGSTLTQPHGGGSGDAVADDVMASLRREPEDDH